MYFCGWRHEHFLGNFSHNFLPSLFLPTSEYGGRYRWALPLPHGSQPESMLVSRPSHNIGWTLSPSPTQIHELQAVSPIHLISRYSPAVFPLSCTLRQDSSLPLGFTGAGLFSASAWKPLCTPGTGVNLWGESPLYVNPVSELYH